MSKKKMKRDHEAMEKAEQEKGTLQPSRFGGWEWIRWVKGETVTTKGETPAEAILSEER